jgi:hypothetical protein
LVITHIKIATETVQDRATIGVFWPVFPGLPMPAIAVVVWLLPFVAGRD